MKIQDAESARKWVEHCKGNAILLMRAKGLALEMDSRAQSCGDAQPELRDGYLEAAKVFRAVDKRGVFL